MNLKVLYIDDDEFMRVFFESYFEEKLEIKTSESAEAAWQQFQSGYTPDLIVLDLGLPGQNGKSFLNELKADEQLKFIPIIILSGNDKSHTRIDMLKAGAEDFIVKPFNPEELEIKIEKFVIHAGKKPNPRYQ